MTALDHGDFEKVPVADALSLLLLALDQQPWGFETAAPRGHARLCHEARLTLPEAQFALAALQTLAGHCAVGGGQALVAVCSARGLDDAVRVLDAWLDAHDRSAEPRHNRAAACVDGQSVLPYRFARMQERHRLGSGAAGRLQFVQVDLRPEPARRWRVWRQPLPRQKQERRLACFSVLRRRRTRRAP